ncbi:unnamed protein product [Closterium sp. Naga37s-1]|nr:unnamed protein product [Closterium sp. Naga37s-1]
MPYVVVAESEATRGRVRDGIGNDAAAAVREEREMPRGAASGSRNARIAPPHPFLRPFVHRPSPLTPASNCSAPCLRGSTVLFRPATPPPPPTEANLGPLVYCPFLSCASPVVLLPLSPASLPSPALSTPLSPALPTSSLLLPSPFPLPLSSHSPPLSAIRPPALFTLPSRSLPPSLSRFPHSPQTTAFFFLWVPSPCCCFFPPPLLCRSPPSGKPHFRHSAAVCTHPNYTSQVLRRDCKLTIHSCCLRVNFTRIYTPSV